MEKVSRFEDLIAWQKARELTAKVYSITSNGNFSKDFGLRDQIRRAAVSVMSNIAEGFERGAATEFHQYLVIAKASCAVSRQLSCPGPDIIIVAEHCAEVRSQLYVALDAGYLPDTQFTSLLQQAEEVGRIIGGLRSAVDKKRRQK